MNEIELSSIVLDPELQPRAAIDQSVVDEYAEQMGEGATFPPITIFDDGSKRWLADGWHRYHAVQKAGIETINADIKQGSRRDALLFSISANAKHGLRRSREDKRRAILALLSDPEWSKLSDRELAKMAGVTHPTVAKYRAGGKFTTELLVKVREYFGDEGLHFIDKFLDPPSPSECGLVDTLIMELPAELDRTADHLLRCGITDICGRQLLAVTETDRYGISYMMMLAPHPAPYRFWMEIAKLDERYDTGEKIAFKKPVTLDYAGFILELMRVRDDGRQFGDIRLSYFSMWCARDVEPSYIPPFRDDYEGLYNDYDLETQIQLEVKRVAGTIEEAMG